MHVFSHHWLVFFFVFFSFFYFYFYFSYSCTRRPHRRADPSPRPANVIGEESTAVIVALNSPTVLQCYAVGWPRPFVTWWRADRMLPMTSETFEQRNDHSLYIRMVTINLLGPYTCQVYNGIGRASSWSVTLQAHDTAVNQPYNPYLVPPPRHPSTGDVIRLKPIIVRLTRPPPIYRTVTSQRTDIETTQPTQQRVFTGKCPPPTSPLQPPFKFSPIVPYYNHLHISTNKTTTMFYSNIFYLEKKLVGKSRDCYVCCGLQFHLIVSNTLTYNFSQMTLEVRLDTKIHVLCQFFVIIRNKTYIILNGNT